MQSWVFYAFLAAVLWGFTYTLDGKSLSYLSPLQFKFLMALGASIILGAAVMVRGEMGSLITAIDHPHKYIWLLASLLTTCAATLLIAATIKMENPTSAAIIEVSYPLFTALFGWLLFRDVHITKDLIIGGALIIAGVVYIASKVH